VPQAGGSQDGLAIASGGASGSRMDREVKNGHCQPLAEVGNHPLAIGQGRPGRLGPRAKVVQTVVCSTFTRGAKPATRRVADGERMSPQGKGGAYAPIPRRR
jgi:hypothetical protein